MDIRVFFFLHFIFLSASFLLGILLHMDLRVVFLLSILVLILLGGFLNIKPYGGHRNVLASKYARHMLYGILWLVGGTVVTVATYKAASGGETYIIAWGAILFGIIEFFSGLIGWLDDTKLETH